MIEILLVIVIITNIINLLQGKKGLENQKHATDQTDAFIKNREREKFEAMPSQKEIEMNEQYQLMVLQALSKYLTETKRGDE